MMNRSSRLYRLGSKKVLADKILLVDMEYLKKVVSESETFYIEKEIQSKNKKRKTEIPKYKLKKIHTKIKNELNKIGTPDYYMSDKGRGHIRNGLIHLDKPYVLTLDIAKYYPSVRSKYVIDFFTNQMKIKRDVAKFLTKLIMYKGILATGSPVSQILAYLTNKVLFDKIHRLAAEHDIKFSLYVDDLAFSSNAKISHEFKQKVVRILKQHQLNESKKKTNFFQQDGVKLVTGLYLNNSGVARCSNSLRKDIFKFGLSRIKRNGVCSLTKSERQTMFGKLCLLRQIEGNKYQNFFLLLKKSLY